MIRSIVLSFLFCSLLLASSGVKERRYAPGEIIIKYEKVGQRARGSEIITQHKSFVDNLELNMKGLKIKSYSPVFKSLIREMTDKNLTEQEVVENKAVTKKNKTSSSFIKKITFSNILLLKIDSVADILELASTLNNNRDLLASEGMRIVYAEPNYLKKTSVNPNDPLYPLQWSYRITDVANAWDTTEGSPNIKIAIVDTGVDPTHPDLIANLIQGYNFVNIDTDYYKQDSNITLLPGEIYTQPGPNCTDYNGHGTHCAGIAAAAGNNGIGIIGVAPNCKIMPVRAGFSLMVDGQEEGVLETTSIVEGINYAVDNGANVISMSFGGDSSNLEEEAIQNAYYNNVVLVAAAGNNSSSEKFYPAGYSEVLAITSVDSTRSASSFTEYGYWTSVAAPGENIISTVPLTGGILTDPSGYKVLSGTSMASPFVAGEVALILSHNPSLSNNLIYQIVRTAVSSYYASNNYIGTGIVDVDKAFIGTGACIAKITVPYNINNLYISKGNISISGRASGLLFRNYYLQYSDYQNSTAIWQSAGQIYTTQVDSGYLGTVSIAQPGVYYIRLVVTSTNNIQYTDIIGPVTVDNRLKSNWPVSTGSPIGSTPVLSDIYGDGNVEVIFTSSNGEIYVVDQNGNNKPGWPVTLPNSSSKSQVGYTSPAVGDLDNDGKKEIAVRDGQFIYVYKNDGTMRNGWPVSLGTNIFSGNAIVGSPTIADINNDGYKEILVTSLNGKIFAFDRNGYIISGWPVSVPINSVWATLYSTPVVSDIKGDGNVEIIIQCIDESSANSIGYLYVFDNFGNVLPGWPQTIGGGSWTSPITADINNDGQNEIIASSFLPSGSSSGSIGLYVFNPAGSLLKGFPVQLNDVSFGYYNIKAGLSAGDINNDGYKEIIVASSQLNSLWAVDRNGKVLWNSQPSEPWEYNFASVPIIADINNDGKPEILVSKYNNTNQTGKIIVVNNTGQIMESLSCVLPEQIWATPSIGDIEGNGNLELICGSIQGNVFCWDLGVPFDTTLMIWPTYQQNYQRTGSIDLLKTIPAVTHLTEPPNNAVIQPGEITFSWNPVPGALKYNFELSDSISFNDIIFQDTSMSAVSLIVDSVQSSSKGLKAGLKNTRTVSAIKKLITNDKKIIDPKKHLTGLNDGVRYYWRVASLDLIGSSPFSAINSFSTILNAPGTLYALALPSERVVLNWSGTSNNNTGFIIQRKLSTDTIYTVIDTVKTDTISFTDTTLTSINTYNYRIEAYNQIETSAFSNVVTIATLPPYPAAPTLIAPINNASILTGSLYLSWISSANASSYRLQVSTDSTFKTFFLNDSVLTTTTFQVTNLSDGLRYYWRVNSKNVTGISIYSGVNSFSTILNAPQNLSAIAMWGYKVSLTWIGKSNDESGYIIERKLSKDTSYTIIDSLKLKVTSFTDSSLTAVNTYNYRITAYNALGTSGFSNLITVNTITSVENKSRQIPVNYELSQNFPNPFNPITVIEYGLPVQSRVKIVVYNILGEVVKELVNSVQSAGYHYMDFGGNMSSGVYFYKIDAKAVNDSRQFMQIKKMMLLK